MTHITLGYSLTILIKITMTNTTIPLSTYQLQAIDWLMSNPASLENKILITDYPIFVLQALSQHPELKEIAKKWKELDEAMT